jgi:hypothetical protein
MSAIIDDTNLDNDHILAQKLADAAEIADDQVFSSSQGNTRQSTDIINGYFLLI